MSKVELTKPIVNVSFLTARTTNYKAIALVKAISKEDSNSIQKIIDSVPTKFEKVQIFQSTFMQEKGSEKITPDDKILCKLAEQSKNDSIIAKIENFARAAGVLNEPEVIEITKYDALIKLPNNSLINAHQSESLINAHQSESLINDLIERVNLLLGNSAFESVAA